MLAYNFQQESRHMTRPVTERSPFAKSYRYRIYTENTHIRRIYAICDKYLTGYTVALTRGVWEKTHEASLYIEYIGSQNDSTIKAIAELIKTRNAQSAVLVTRESIESVLI